MRQIKFRAKTIKSNKWVYGHYFITPLSDEDSGTDPSAGWYFLTGEKRHCIANENGAVFVIDPETLGQSTGLFDKNEKEIWEGDFISCCDQKGVCRDIQVKYENHHIGDFHNWQIHGFRDYSRSTYGFEIEIIGNIYEGKSY